MLHFPELVAFHIASWSVHQHYPHTNRGYCNTLATLAPREIAGSYSVPPVHVCVGRFLLGYLGNRDCHIVGLPSNNMVFPKLIDFQKTMYLGDFHILFLIVFGG